VRERGPSRRRWAAGVAGAVAALVATGTALGFGFKAPQTYDAGASAYPVRIADLNKDGKRDVVVGNLDDDDVSVYLGKGNGKLEAQHTYPAGDSPFGIAVSDFDRDGKKDLAVVDENGAAVSILLGKGDGSFKAPLAHNVGGDPYFIATGRFEAGKRQDLAVADCGGMGVDILLGKKHGNFGSPVFHPTTDCAASVAVADFDRDGKQDVIALDYVNGYELFRGKGNGDFRSPLSFPSGTDTGQGMVVGDFNHDHRVDVAANNCVTSPSTSNVYVRLGMGNGKFKAIHSYKGGDCAYQPGVADVNGDGNLDLLESNYIDFTLDVLLGKHDGTFKPVRSFPATASDTYSVAAGRLDAGKSADLAVPDYGNAKVAILLNKG
jgi:hypothetical protein